MSQTVIGIFEKSADAQEAKQTLISNGFDLSQIDVNHNVDADDDRTTDGQRTETGGKISNFFSRLFDDEDESDRYTRAGSRGSIVTVHAVTEQEALAAADILDDCGAVDVNEFAGSQSGISDVDSYTGSQAGTLGTDTYSSAETGTVDPLYTSGNSSFLPDEVYSTPTNNPGTASALRDDDDLERLNRTRNYDDTDEYRTTADYSTTADATLIHLILFR